MDDMGIQDPRIALAELFSSRAFLEEYHYDGELGAIYSPESTLFRLWAPTASAVDLILYAGDSPDEPESVLPMESRDRGIWERMLPGDQDGRHYEYSVCAQGRRRTAVDPYAKAVGMNGRPAMVLAPGRGDPEGWSRSRAPRLGSPADAVVYELHVRDMTSSPDWNGPQALRGLYGGVVQRGTVLPGSPRVSTGFDHIRELGVTHVQLMPVFDFSSVDEGPGSGYNWGYDPANFNAPEGSYSQDPRKADSRIRELKSMIMAFNDSGIGVVMDVVYNHVPDRARSNLEACVPGYYLRPHDDSGAGSDLASERSMARAYIVDSCRHWLSEYKLSGFRFDLMGLCDLETMEEVAAALRRVKGDVLLYGEGWDMYSGKAMRPASMRNAQLLPGIGMFNDAFRCAIKGSVFWPGARGWIHDGGRHESLKFGIVGAVAHPQVDNGSVIGTARPQPWTENAWQSVSYTEVHDNLTLADKLLLVEPDSDEERREALARMASALVLLSQGMPLLQAGMEFMRSKELPQDELRSGKLDEATPLPDLSRAFSHNSYRASDRVNAIAWGLKAKRARHCRYVEGLIALRRAHQAFRLGTGDEIRRRLSFVKDGPGILSFLIDMEGTADPWRSILVAANAREREATMRVGADGPWSLVSDGRTVDLDARERVPAGVFRLEPKSVVVLCRKR